VRHILELATKARLPLISAWSEFAESGGLMTYGTNVPAMFRHAAAVADRILRGANPAEIPVERATTFELVIGRSLRDARAIRPLGGLREGRVSGVSVAQTARSVMMCRDLKQRPPHLSFFTRAASTNDPQRVTVS
jgi:hypothetical protein